MLFDYPQVQSMSAFTLAKAQSNLPLLTRFANIDTAALLVRHVLFDEDLNQDRPCKNLPDAPVLQL